MDVLICHENDGIFWVKYTWVFLYEMLYRKHIVLILTGCSLHVGFIRNSASYWWENSQSKFSPPEIEKVCCRIGAIHIWEVRKSSSSLDNRGKPLPVNRCSQKNSRWWVGLSSQKSSGAAHNCLKQEWQAEVIQWTLDKHKLCKKWDGEQ